MTEWDKVTTRYIGDVTSDEFAVGNVLTLTYGSSGQTTETFIITRVGRIAYAVSMQHGYARTRPQLIQHYGKVGATYALTITQH